MEEASQSPGGRATRSKAHLFGSQGCSRGGVGGGLYSMPRAASNIGLSQHVEGISVSVTCTFVRIHLTDARWNINQHLGASYVRLMHIELGRTAGRLLSTSLYWLDW